MKRKLNAQPSTLARTQEYIDYWVPRLRLRDWVFEIKVHTDPETFKSFASGSHNRNFQNVLIEVLEPERIPADWTGKRDLEVTIVHELLHTRWINLPRPCENDQPHEEMAIETVATLMVALKRGIEPEDIK